MAPLDRYRKRIKQVIIQQAQIKPVSGEVRIETIFDDRSLLDVST